jgi:hypothetical protein
MLDGATGNTGANGVYQIRSLDANNFELRGSNGNGAYVTGGIVYTGKPVIRIAGPTVNIHLEDVLIDAGGASSNPVDISSSPNLGIPTATVGIEYRHNSSGGLKNIFVTKYAHMALNFRTANVASPINGFCALPPCFVYFNCNNVIDSFEAASPVSWRTSGINIGGWEEVSGADSCSNLFNKVNVQTGGGPGSFGINEGYSDNNLFTHMQVALALGQGDTWRRVPALNIPFFPKANQCSKCFIQTMSGTAGVGPTSQTWFPDFPEQEQGVIQPALFGDTSGISDLGNAWGMAFIDRMPDENYQTVAINKMSGAQNGAGTMDWQRESNTRGRIKAQYYEGFTYYFKDPAIGILDPIMQMKINGALRYRKSFNAGTFPGAGAGADTGDTVFCPNCDSNCNAGGTGRIALFNGSGWVCQ